MKKKEFKLTTQNSPQGDQPEAISSLVNGVRAKLAFQTLLGVTGSGKTFTMAHVINELKRPSLIIAPNKTLAAQLYGEMSSFFPQNAVEYFVSYYDYYQPEAYVPTTDTYIAKDASINETIDKMRLSATKALLERRDAIVIATVSAIYGLGDPNSYLKMVLHLKVGEIIDQRKILASLTSLQYIRNDYKFKRGYYAVRGEIIDIYPAESSEYAIRILLFDDEIESIRKINPLTKEDLGGFKRITIYPVTHYVTPKEIILKVIKEIKNELKIRLVELKNDNNNLAAERLKNRALHDIDMLEELGYCQGIENYSRYLSGQKAGQPPPTLLDYISPDTIIFIDESHVTIPQIGGMYKGDRSRKENLVNFGFRLPSALDNRPLTFEEFIKKIGQVIFVSATPGEYEKIHSKNVAEQLIRPTGLVDPKIEIRKIANQVSDITVEIKKRIAQNQRTLITTLTKRMAEDLTDYLNEKNVKARYLHADIDTIERVEIIRDLRFGAFHVLVGINLLREGLDIPEVALVAILDGDQEGFLRCERSLIQTIGRAARNEFGQAIIYADKITKSIKKAYFETERRRQKQRAYNEKYNIVPQSVQTEIKDIINESFAGYKKSRRSRKDSPDFKKEYIKVINRKDSFKEIKRLERMMHQSAKDLEFEKAIYLRNKIEILRKSNDTLDTTDKR